MKILPPTVVLQLKRFRQQRRAWVSLWLLLGIYGLSLLADVYAPYGPKQTMSAEDIDLPDEVELIRVREQRVGFVQVNAELRVLREQDAAFFLGREMRGETIELPSAIENALTSRFANETTAAVDVRNEESRFIWSLSTYEPRRRAPRSARIILREVNEEAEDASSLVLDAGGEPMDGEVPVWFSSLPAETLTALRIRVAAAMEAPVDPLQYEIDGQKYELRFVRETVQFPFRPVEGHPLGLDESGRDVYVQILYATRIALSFGFLLVLCSAILGTLIGGLQGYFGGWWDLIGQRMVEVYESIPFLYVMILLGSIFGRSFWLLLLVYAAFNWVGISYYMRAEFFKGRAQPYAEAARALGLSTGRIMWRHILPNSLVPLITLFPFLLVGAIGSLSALDYLGFGMPVGTPSWGDLLRQAQRYRYAWWLIAYPSLALFVVILLGVFIGEGLRAAFDPKRATRWEA